MQTDRQFGFSLRPDPEDKVRYDDIKDYIERICNHVKNCSIYYGVPNLMFAFRVKKDLYITAKMQGDEAEFALYKQGQNTLIRHATVSDLSFLTDHALEIIKNRIDNTAYTISRDNLSISFGEIERAWNKETYIRSKEYKSVQTRDNKPWDKPVVINGGSGAISKESQEPEIEEDEGFDPTDDE